VRRTIGGFLAVVTLQVSTAAQAEGPEIASSAPPNRPREERHWAAGLHGGLLPPIFAVAELLARPIPHVALGAFGMALPSQFTIGGELLVEYDAPEVSSGYTQLAVLHFANTSEHWERAQVLYITAGYLWKFDSGLELQLGGGALFILADKGPPCTGEFCVRFEPPPILPTAELAVRYRFL
jgi:hypothetical protein